MTVRRRSRARRYTALVAALAALASLTQPISAQATEYATWEEVEQARESESEAKALTERIRDQIDGLEAAVLAAESEADRKGAAYAEADQVFQEAAAESASLEAKLQTAREAAAEAYRQAGQVAVELSRTGGPDVAASLIGNDSPEDLLLRMSSIDRVGKVADSAYREAARSRNEVDALAAQADAAEAVLAERRDEAEALLLEAQRAMDAALAAMDEQVARQAELEAQLEVLTENRVATEQDFAAGEAARRAEAEARARADAQARAEAEARARARAEAEARARAEAESGAGIGGGEAPSSGGWANPTSGWISSAYGYRLHPVYKTWRLHTGTDVAGGCGAAIYAAASGTVTYSGRYGSYGNFILISNGGGVDTGYAHIEDGGLLVRSGQQVSAGQLIARQGTTGASTGCHLHFEVRQGGVATDPVPYLRARGTGIGG